MRFESWVERQIREAIERGEFDDLPGAGQPIPGLTGVDEDNWWVKGFLDREKLPMPLPASLALKREVERLPETLSDVRDEATVRAMVDALNDRIRDSHRRRLDGPPVITKLVDVQAAVERWQAERPKERGPR